MRDKSTYETTYLTIHVRDNIYIFFGPVVACDLQNTTFMTYHRVIKNYMTGATSGAEKLTYVICDLDIYILTLYI